MFKRNKTAVPSDKTGLSVLPVLFGLLIASIAGIAGWVSYLDYKNPTDAGGTPSAITEIAPVTMGEDTPSSGPEETTAKSDQPDGDDTPITEPAPNAAKTEPEEPSQKPAQETEVTASVGDQPEPSENPAAEVTPTEAATEPEETQPDASATEGSPPPSDKTADVSVEKPEKPEPEGAAADKEDRDKPSDPVVASVDPETAKKFKVEKVPEGERVTLAPAPDPELTKRSDFGLLPIVGPAGKMPWRTYARPFVDPLDRPRIAIVMSDMGMSKSATQTAIQKLPGAITLSFNPYARNLQDWINQARAAGHEVLLQLPMEPMGYPENDPGPHSLLTSLTDRENLNRLDWMLGRFTGYSGVTNQMGSRFTSSTTDIEPILSVLNERGLLFLDGRTSSKSVASRLASSMKMPVSVNNRFLDNKADRATIDARLADLERIARYTGTAIGVGYPYPVTLERLAVWAQTLNRKGLVLSPISATVNRQEIR